MVVVSRVNQGQTARPLFGHVIIVKCRDTLDQNVL